VSTGTVGGPGRSGAIGGVAVDLQALALLVVGSIGALVAYGFGVRVGGVAVLVGRRAAGIGL
jgi:hypothetical protein